MKRLGLVVAVVALLAAACGDDNKSTTTASSTPAAGGGDVTIDVGANFDDMNGEFFAYFPDAVTAHPGDTIKFESKFRGEPHTVAFGTVFTAGLKAFGALPEDQRESAESNPVIKKAADLIDLLPEGPGDADQRAANPCVIATGDVPADKTKACAESTKGKQFHGTETYFNAGFLEDGTTFELDLADDIAPGEYSWVCLLHGPDMHGTLTVAAQSAKATTAAEAKAARDKSLAEIRAKLQPLHDQAEKATADKAVAGLFDQELQTAYLAEFGPAEAAVPVGGSVTWDVSGAHTIAFGASEEAVGLMVKGPDGKYHANDKLGAPADSPPPPPPPDGEPKPDAKPVVIDGGKYSGTGYKNSGLLLAFGPPGMQYKVTFTKAGTFDYRCLVHPDMKGKVKVG